MHVDELHLTKFDRNIDTHLIDRAFGSDGKPTRLTTLSGKAFKTLATRKTPSGWSVIEVERVNGVGFFERVVGEGYASEQVAEAMAKVLMGVVESE